MQKNFGVIGLRKKENKRQIQRKTKSIVKSLANLFMQFVEP